MEKRFNQRKPFAIRIKLDVPNKGLMDASTLDMSLGGMSVDLGLILLAQNEIVNVTFLVDCGDEARQCMAKAVVAHNQLGRIGLTFRDLDSKVKQMLRKELFGYATVSQRAYLAQVQKFAGNAVFRRE